MFMTDCLGEGGNEVLTGFSNYLMIQHNRIVELEEKLEIVQTLADCMEAELMESVKHSMTAYDYSCWKETGELIWERGNKKC